MNWTSQTAETLPEREQARPTVETLTATRPTKLLLAMQSGHLVVATLPEGEVAINYLHIGQGMVGVQLPAEAMCVVYPPANNVTRG